MNEHTLNILEFPKVISLIRGKCLTPFGASEVSGFVPMYDPTAIRQRQSEISQMKDIINFGTPFPLYRLEDCTEEIRQSTVEGIFLEPKQILTIGNLVSVSIEIERYDKDNRDNFPLIAEYLNKIRAFPELKTDIHKAIDETGEVKDTASRKLKEIRSELVAGRQKIINRLEQILGKQTKQAGWQDDIVTMRNERYVIGIPTSQYRGDMGILHDRSQSGATFYVEPQETVELNNRINMLYQEERQEIIRILKTLTTEIGRRAEALLENIRLIGKLDSFHAAGTFSNAIKGNRPTIIDRPDFDLRNVRHPLLIMQFTDAAKVVANNIALDDSRQGILITGPNTGGKTVALKTIGLSILMAQAGLHISADELSEVGIFEDIFADIGDEQSIELSLSTFSSHVRNIISGLNAASDKVLLLYDEIGAGTDPKEGAALAESIILHALDRGAKLIVTTHYSQLKTLAMEYPQIENASLEFDRQTFAPTYKLRLGLPGSSYAIEIAGRLGMPPSICTRASSLLGTGEKSLDSLIDSLEQELADLKKNQREREERLRNVEQLESLYKSQTEHLKKEVESEKKKALEETRSFLEQTRKDIERLVADIRTSGASDETVKKFHHQLRRGEDAVRRMLRESQPKVTPHTSFEKGDRVEIISLNQKGEISEMVGKDKARIKVGNVFTVVELRNLKKTDFQAESDFPRSSATSYQSEEEPAGTEIDLRGMTGDEAIEALERFLDQAIVSGLHHAYVIHGKGTGALRRKLTDYLKSHPDVASMRLGNWNEGGAGVTVIRLKG
ncbi:MAG: endonuclease MutS2 [Candidatus Zixiibacteriota bacterium]